jgi:hypothetical protein
MKKSENNNYLDKIPVQNPKHTWDKNDKDEVTIYIENTGVFNRAAQKLLKKPKVTNIHLEGLGNFIWPLIDGERSIYDIGLLVKEEYGEEAEPLFPRLVTYMKTLESYDFITFK